MVDVVSCWLKGWWFELFQSERPDPRAIDQILGDGYVFSPTAYGTDLPSFGDAVGVYAASVLQTDGVSRAHRREQQQRSKNWYACRSDQQLWPVVTKVRWPHPFAVLRQGGKSGWGHHLPTGSFETPLRAVQVPRAGREKVWVFFAADAIGGSMAVGLSICVCNTIVVSVCSIPGIPR